MRYISIVVAAVAGLAVASCNTTSSMNVPKANNTGSRNIDAPVSRQASFALSKILANLKRGTTIGHFPASGVEGVEGYGCNAGMQGNATVEWGAGSSDFGNWSTELGENFYEVLTQKGLNIAGDPTDLFNQRDAAISAEYFIGARISELKSNYCQPVSFWDGDPIDECSGETYIKVEWTIFSNLLQREVLKTTTEGYFKLIQPKREGIALTFQNAFANAAENLTSSGEFIDIALRKNTGETEEAVGTKILISNIIPKQNLAANNLGQILPAVVTIRVGFGHGSGFVIAENGLILTNAHVVKSAKSVGIILSNGVEIEGEVLRKHDRRDVALIKVPIRVPSVLAIRQDAVSPLEKIYVVGTPAKVDLKSTITTGIVSALRYDEQTGLDFIQADAAISGGNSGGPLLDEGGNVIGISVLKIITQSSEGLNLFIPIVSALEALNLAYPVNAHDRYM